MALLIKKKFGHLFSKYNISVSGLTTPSLETVYWICKGGGKANLGVKMGPRPYVEDQNCRDYCLVI
jgi:hypothetical protein